ncbi:pyridoxamine 5'-phosphate oxidase [Flavihumibacter profundi]|jgi:pyridoxamine 5'-phosphate oxidase|uniref:pyridoxamine 5'-phosphate oxidase n=1 Tax=Flavihumibacter profundi TaxID=2716883 RepID=UPI001CC77C08|nr:pyridoxamine 5'-phosphate oxidase [Flavihumibacter profundi]MBZ5858728.1 pyridoxamine 5'-phosphate oxidase [Flavihumibacter profundi]
MSKPIADIRIEYKRHSLSEKDVQHDPIRQFDLWWTEAISSQIEEVNAMTLATASSDGLPSARIVLLKGFTEEGFVFFTNYNSYKGQQLDENPRACLVFFWKELERQVRITGLIEKVSAEESDVYFSSRPESSRIGAWASPQSKVIESRGILETTEAELQKAFEGKEIPRPLHWGGYRLKPVSVEFWQGRPSRLHDRIHYSLEETGNWRIERLAP